MASIKKRPDGSWRARYRDPDGRERAKHFDRRVDAEQWLTSVEHKKLTGEYVDPTAGKVRFRDYAEQWRARQVHRPTTTEQLRSNLERHVYPALGDRAMNQVRPGDVQALVKTMSKKLAPGTVAMVYRYVASIFRAAVRDRVVSMSPCVDIRLPKQERRQIEPLATEQVRGLVEGMPERWRALVVVGAGTGLRQGEAFGLTVDRVDFLRRRLTVDRQVILADDRPQWGPPKTQAGYRTVPLPDVVLEALSAHVATFEVGDEGLVFTDRDGGMIDRRRFGEVWRPVARDVGLPPRTGFHALRHYYASLLIRHGESVKVVQSRLGHASAAETLDTYSHLWPEDEDRTREAVDAVLNAPDEDLAESSRGLFAD